MKKILAYSLGTALALVGLVFTLAPTVRTYAVLEVAQTFSALKTFTAGIAPSTVTSATIDTPLAVTYNTTTNPATSVMGATIGTAFNTQTAVVIPDATTPPVIGGTPESTLGSCTTATPTYRFYAVYSNPSGATSASAATPLSYTVTGGTTRKVVTTRPASGIPAGASHWRLAWANAADSYATISYCSNTYTSLAGAGSNVLCDCRITVAQCTGSGTPFACCTGAGAGSGTQCTGYGPAPTSNTTFAINPFRFLDGSIYATTGTAGTPGAVVADNTRLKFGTAGAIGLSVDAGANYYNILTSNTGASKGTTVVTICASGCDYADLNAACAAKTSTAVAPLLFDVKPGIYTSGAAVSCSGQVGAIFQGYGAKIVNTQTGGADYGALEFGTSSDYRVQGFWVKGKRAIFVNPAGASIGDAVFSDMILEQNAVNADEDCIFLWQLGSGSRPDIHGNWCKQHGDGLTVKSGGDGVVFIGYDNYFTSTGTTNGYSGYTFEGIPCTTRLGPDRFDVLSNGSGQPIAYKFDGNQTGCASGAVASITGSSGIISQTGGGAANSSAYGIQILSTATELATLTVNGVNLDVRGGCSGTCAVYGYKAETGATTNTTFNGGRIRTSGGSSNTDVVSNTASVTTVNGLDYQTYSVGAGTFDTNLVCAGGCPRTISASCSGVCRPGETCIDTTPTRTLCVCVGDGTPGNAGAYANMNNGAGCS